MKSQLSQKTIFTIGHSTHDIGEFIAMLTGHSISLLVDVRNFPSSRRYPHFNSHALESSLIHRNIRYLHMPGLGGRRKPLPDSTNNRWRNSSFRGYADYMTTDAFRQAAGELEASGLQETVAYMCAEAVWWSCHRKTGAGRCFISWHLTNRMRIHTVQRRGLQMGNCDTMNPGYFNFSAFPTGRLARARGRSTGILVRLKQVLENK